MRIRNIHQFTEHHRFYMYRDFSLSGIDMKMLQLIYQPMVGAAAAGLYQLLYYQVDSDRVGYSGLEPQRRLFLGLGLEMNDGGRRQLATQASRLEAVGLLQSSQLLVPEGEDVIYEYELLAPQSPIEFFRNQHLTMYLRDQVGKHAVIHLREQFFAAEPDELAHAEPAKENLSVPFYELFQLGTAAVDHELEQALTEVAPSREPAPRPAAETAGIQYGEIIMRFPRHSANRPHVEKLRSDVESMATLNYVAYKYSLTVVDLCRLLDEDGIFTARGELLEDELQLRANKTYRQERKRGEDRQRVLARMSGGTPSQAEDELPTEHAVDSDHRLDVPAQLAGRCDIAQYNMLMRNEPHTRFLMRFFPGAVPEWLDRVFERIDLNYRLAAPVINVLIHYVLGQADNKRVNKSFIDAVAANMLLKQVDTFEKAVRYVREQGEKDQQGGSHEQRSRESGGSAGSGRRSNTSWGGRRKPDLPIIEDSGEQPEISETELEELRQLARKLDGKG
ncbi:helicase DnaB [Paenibacillus sp. 1P07SE]|uniref:helicase DnaB n=1 Tax=Paenibacillus sp. 1P07SE TaxID=3132209 RepID=UPI0039A592FD